MTHEQRQIYKILEFFAEFCTSHKLQYYLAGGTLLGAIRHHGFIPWDDDIDVVMPENDYQKLMNLAHLFPGQLVIQSQQTDPRYPFLFAKLCNKDIPFVTSQPYAPKGIYIDIFPLISARKCGKVVSVLFHTLKVAEYVLQIKFEWCNYVAYKRHIARIGFYLLKKMPVFWIRQLQQTIVSMIRAPYFSPVYCSIGGIHKANQEFYPKEWFEPGVSASFETCTYCVPKKWNEYLTMMYGEWEKIPQEAQRISRHKI